MDLNVMHRALAGMLRFPGRHNQSRYARPKWRRSWQSWEAIVSDKRRPSCLTTLCLAGWIIYQNAPVGTRIKNGYAHLPDGTKMGCHDYAMQIAGLTPYQAQDLFQAKRRTPIQLYKLVLAYAEAEAAESSPADVLASIFPGDDGRDYDSHDDDDDWSGDDDYPRGDNEDERDAHAVHVPVLQRA